MRVRSARIVLSAIRDWPARARRAQYNAAMLAKECGVRRRALERFFHKTLTMPPQQWLDQMRQIEAEELAQTEKRTKEIADLLGYKQPSHFCRHFKRAHGMSVKLWKKLASTFYGFSPKPTSPKPTEKPSGRKKCRVARR
jgi:AraC-like DNA-binding protein